MLREGHKIARRLAVSLTEQYSNHLLVVSLTAIMLSIFLLLAWSALLNFSQASPLYGKYLEKRATTGATPLPPSRDPFYTAPKNYESAAPGAVLRVREAPGNITSALQNCSAAYNILYRTTNSQYKPAWAVTTLYLPVSKPTKKSTASSSISPGDALLSYQIPYDSADVDSSPSYAVYSGIYSGGGSDIPAALGRGWFVSVPDYEGPLASFTAGVMSGHATLDSVRAVLSSGFGLSANARYAMWGYSGGALASEWAAELQVQYAPELEFSGAALGGLTPNVTSVMLTVNGTVEAGLIPSGILGLASQYPEAYDFLVSQLKTSGKYNKTGFLAAKNMTLDQAILNFADHDIYAYFQNGSAEFQTPLVQKIINSDGLMGYHGIPQIPIYAYKAIHDEVSKIADSDALVDKYCAVGASILYQRNTVGGHEAEYVNGDARAFEWLADALSGKLQQTGCVIQNVTVALDSSPL